MASHLCLHYFVDHAVEIVVTDPLGAAADIPNTPPVHRGSVSHDRIVHGWHRDLFNDMAAALAALRLYASIWPNFPVKLVGGRCEAQQTYFSSSRPG